MEKREAVGYGESYGVDYGGFSAESISVLEELITHTTGAILRKLMQMIHICAGNEDIAETLSSILSNF